MKRSVCIRLTHMETGKTKRRREINVGHHVREAMYAFTA